MRSEFEYQALNEDGKLSFDMWEHGTGRSGLSLSQLRLHFGRGGPHASLPSFMISFHRVDDEPDLEAYLSVWAMDRVLGDLLDSEQAAAGIRQPRLTMSMHWKNRSGNDRGALSSDDSSPISIWTDLRARYTSW